MYSRSLVVTVNWRYGILRYAWYGIRYFRYVQDFRN